MTTASSTPTNFSKRKKRNGYPLWLNLHLYLGLSIGLIFVLAGLTGSALVFYVELDELLNPALQITEEQSRQKPQPYEALFQSIRKSQPERNGAWRLEAPRHSQAMVMARYYKAKEKEHVHFAPLIAWVNPYTAEVVSTRFWGDYVMTWIYDLHYELLLDTTGKILMGIIGILLLFVVLIGVYLWWPKPGKLKSALTFKPNASTERFIYDLHKVNGMYGLLVLFLLLVSGAILELPDYFNPLLNKLSPLYEPPANFSSGTLDKTRISLDEAVTIATNRYPQAQVRWIETPANERGTFNIKLYQDGEPSKRFPKTTVWIDQYNGKIVSMREPKSQGFGDTFLNWMHPLHSGEIAGLPGRILVLASGFVPLALYVTGLLRWRQKRRAKIRKTLVI
ncbi:MAG: PepSY domain-containing protein [Methylococcaceae bacterium]|nr:PepSY domain-containing protein [Methylococcaceae bacterium]